jgi:hypothetical protein
MKTCSMLLGQMEKLLSAQEIRVPAWQAHGSQFKPQHHQKKGKLVWIVTSDFNS